MLYKLDKNGYADEVNLEHLGETTDIELSGFTLERFRQMCILSGCDYLDAIPGFGLKTCHKYFAKYKTADRVLQAIRAEFPSKVPDDYERRFAMAELTFCHQRVYDHRSQELVHLHPVSEEFIMSSDQDYGNWDFVGPHIDHETAKAIALGQIDPVSREPFKRASVLDMQESQNTIPTLKLDKGKEKEEPKIRSRFFKPISKDQHEEQLQKRLTLKPRSLLSEKENYAPAPLLAQVRSISTNSAASSSNLPHKRTSAYTYSQSIQKDFAASKIPTHLYVQPGKKSESKPIRLDTKQPSINSFLKKKT